MLTVAVIAHSKVLLEVPVTALLAVAFLVMNACKDGAFRQPWAAIPTACRKFGCVAVGLASIM